MSDQTSHNCWLCILNHSKDKANPSLSVKKKSKLPSNPCPRPATAYLSKYILDWIVSQNPDYSNFWAEGVEVFCLVPKSRVCPTCQRRAYREFNLYIDKLPKEVADNILEERRETRSVAQKMAQNPHVPKKLKYETPKESLLLDPSKLKPMERVDFYCRSFR